MGRVPASTSRPMRSPGSDPNGRLPAVTTSNITNPKLYMSAAAVSRAPVGANHGGGRSEGERTKSSNEGSRDRVGRHGSTEKLICERRGSR